MSDNDTSHIERLSKINEIFLLKSKRECLDTSYDKLVNSLKKLSWEDAKASQYFGNKLWFWQTCNEFGYFITTDSINQPFGDVLPLE